MRYFFKAAWSPTLITVLAIIGYLYEWPVEILGPTLVLVLVIGLITLSESSRDRKLEHLSFRLRELTGYFYRRFAGSSSLSIFAIINSLSSLDNPRVLEWVGACNTSEVVFNAWGNGFTSRVESGARGARFSSYISAHLGELWSLVTHYHEFVEAFYEVAVKMDVPQETLEHYNRFSVEYNSFVQSFQTYISELRSAAMTEIEPPSIKLARELPSKTPPKPKQAAEEKPATRDEHKGYIL